MLYNTERPMTFDSVVGQKYIVESIRAQAKNNKFFGVYVFGGHFGCGKTSMARILTLASNCEHLDENGNPCLECEHCKSILSGSPDIIELDAATNTGVDSIRELRETVSFKPVELRRKVYIIDEVHMLSKGAFNALLKVLEEPPEFVTFILCTTEVNAIPATIRSRGACYFFEQLTVDELIGHVENVAKKNGITLLEGAANLIAKYSQGAARNALSILDQVSSVDKVVSAKMVQELLGVSDNEVLFRFAKALLTADTMKAVGLINEFESHGKDFSLLCDDLIEIITDAVLFTIGGEKTLRNTELYASRMKEMISGVTTDRLCVLADHLHSLKGELRISPEKSTVLAAAIRLTMDTNNSVIALSARISALERELAEVKANGVASVSTVKSSVVEPVIHTEEPIAEPVSEEGDKVLALVEEENIEKTVEVSVSEIEEMVTESTSIKMPVVDFEPIADMDSPFGNESLTDDVPAKEEPKSSVTDDFDFDPFDLWGGFDNHVSNTMPTENETVVQPDISNVKEEMPSVSKEAIEETRRLINRIATEHVIFGTALKGCVLEEHNDGLHVVTDIEELKNVVRIYVDLYNRQGFDVKNLIV